MVYFLLVLMLLIVAAGVCAVLVVMMAFHLLRPPRMTDGKAMYVLKRLDPSDLGLAYEERVFEIRDEATGGKMNVPAWWIPAKIPSSSTVIILHGYSDAKVGGIAWAPLWQSIGWNVLAIDLRAHGQAGGRNSTAGYFERHDVNQIVDQLRASHPNATRELALFGISLGATVAAAVGAMRDDLFAVIMDSPYADYPTAIATHGRRLAMPVEWSFPLAMKLAEQISGARFGEVSPSNLIPQVKSPLLVIHSGDDTFVTPQQHQALDDAIAKRPACSISQKHIIQNSEHTLGLRTDTNAYCEIVTNFVTTVRDAASSSPTHQ